MAYKTRKAKKNYSYLDMIFHPSEVIEGAFKVKKIREIEEPFFMKIPEETVTRAFGTDVGAVIGMFISASAGANPILFTTGAVIGGSLGYLATRRLQNIGKTVYEIEGKKIVADNEEDAVETYKQYLEHKKEPHKFNIFHFKSNKGEAKVVVKK